MKLRPYQKDQVLAVRRELATRQSTLVVSGTGTGKSLTLSVCAEVHLKLGGRRVLVLAPRDELIAQQKKTFLRAVPRLREIDVAVEKAEQRAASGTPVVIASPQSLYGERLRSAFRPEGFTLLIVDEAHLMGDLLEAVIHYFDGAKVVGFTATPDRLDGKPLMPFPYESIAHVYELPDAIAQGYLSPLKFEQAWVPGLDFSVFPVNDRVNDLTDEQVEAAWLARGQLLVAAAAAVLTYCADLKTLIFCPTVRTARLLADTFAATPTLTARAMDGTAPDRERRETMEWFREPGPKVLCNCMLYSYGLDVPDLGCVVLARPTKSRALMSQMVGRVTRLFPGKEHGLVLDLVGNVGRHKLVTPEEALRPSGVIQGAPPPDSAVDLVAAQEADLAADAETSRALAEIDSDTLSRLASSATVETRSVDPELAVFGLEIPTREQNDRNATPAQVEALRRAGIAQPDFLSFDQAQALFEALEARRAEGICTLKMGRVLARKGLNPNATFSDAEWAVEKIKANNWRTPPAVLARPGLRYGGSAALRVKEV